NSPITHRAHPITLEYSVQPNASPCSLHLWCAKWAVQRRGSSGGRQMDTGRATRRAVLVVGGVALLTGYWKDPSRPAEGAAQIHPVPAHTVPAHHASPVHRVSAPRA